MMSNISLMNQDDPECCRIFSIIRALNYVEGLWYSSRVKHILIEENYDD